MKTEIKQTIIYIAEDGKSFENEKDCAIYEEKLKLYSQLRFYNSEYNPLHFRNFYDVNFENVDVIVAESEAAQKFINSIADKRDFCEPFRYPTAEKRIVCWDSNNFVWNNAENLIEQIETEIEELQDKLSRLKKIKEL